MESCGLHINIVACYNNHISLGRSSMNLLLKRIRRRCIAPLISMF